jgi:hypothetical protein
VEGVAADILQSIIFICPSILQKMFEEQHERSLWNEAFLRSGNLHQT